MVDSAAPAEAAAGATTSASNFLAPANLSTFHSRLRLVSILSHTIIVVVSLVAVIRTLRYVLRRRSGLIGPAHATRLVKFWSSFGLLYSAHTALTLYLSPLGLGALVTAPFAVAATALSIGARVPLSIRAYDGLVCTFFETHAPEIETYLAALNQHLASIDEGTSALAEHLLQHLSVGGLTGMGRAFTRLFSEAEAAESEAAASGGESAAAAAVKRPSQRLPASSVVGGSGAVAPGGGSRSFFAGAAHERADASAEDASGFVRANVKDTQPKPAYDASRALREQFRRRRSMGGSSSTGDSDSVASLDALPDKLVASDESGDVRRRRR